jgi:hypothetical protein
MVIGDAEGSGAAKAENVAATKNADTARMRRTSTKEKIVMKKAIPFLTRSYGCFSVVGVGCQPCNANMR